MISIVSREGWGAAAPKRKPIVRTASTRKGVVFHWNGPAVKDLDAGLERERAFVRAVQRFHMQKWSDIAYSDIIGQSGTVYVCRGAEWDQFANGEDRVGADDGDDSKWYTIMWIGGEGQTPSSAALRSFEAMTAYYRTLGAGRECRPHLDFQPKTCPGGELTTLARSLHNEMITRSDDMFTDADRELLNQIRNAIYGGDGGGPIGERIREIHEGIRAVRVNGVECTCAASDTADAALIAKAVADELRNRLAQ